MSLLQKYMEKMTGAKSFMELNQEEKETYRTWEEALSGRKLTDDDVADFLDKELDDTLSKLEQSRFRDKDDSFLKARLSILRSVKRFLNGPKMEKMLVEQQIKSQLNQ